MIVVGPFSSAWASRQPLTELLAAAFCTPQAIMRDAVRRGKVSHYREGDWFPLSIYDVYGGGRYTVTPLLFNYGGVDVAICLGGTPDIPEGLN